MKTINGLPVFEAVISLSDELDGLTCISIVDCPAVEKSYECFQEKEISQFSIESQEEQRILGVLMRADYPIYRNNPEMGEFYITFGKETLKTMAEKYLHDGFTSNFSFNHNGENLDGIDLVQLFIKDETKGISPKGFEDIEDGSLFCELKVNDSELWNTIKNGDFTGFSIECTSSLVPSEFSKTQEPDRDKELKSLIYKIYNKLN